MGLDVVYYSSTSKTDDDFRDGKHLIFKGFGNFGGDCPVSKKRAFACEVVSKIQILLKSGQFLRLSMFRSLFCPKSLCRKA